MILTDKQQDTLRHAAEPLMQWLRDNCHQHVEVIVSPVTTELFESIALLSTKREI